MPRPVSVALVILLPVLLACTANPAVNASVSTSPSSDPTAVTTQGQSAGQRPGNRAAANIHRANIRWDKVRSGFSGPTQVTSAPDGTKRLFVVQEGGQVKIVKGGHVQNAPYLNLASRVTTAGEGGLLSIAFSPRFRHNGLLWVAYARSSDGDLVIARMKANRAKASRVHSSTLRPILRVEHSSQDNHYGGQLVFGPDGFLYVGTGDGGGTGNPYHSAGNKNDLRGKILRLDVMRSCGHQHYCSPRGNPYVGKQGRDEVWLLGLRNPWRFSFDRATKDLWIGDVGQDAVEEIDHVKANPKHRNLGWSCREGNQGYDSGQCRKGVKYVDPVTTVRHPVAESITGGFVYRGHKYSWLRGTYLFGDYVTARVWLYAHGQGKAVQSRRLGGSYSGPTSFGQDDRGEIYAVTYGGTLWRMTASRGR